jgi:hypothetical protein
MRLLDDLACPEDPSGLLLLLGNHHKALTLHQLSAEPAPANSRRSHGEIHLTVSSLAEGMQRPVIVADGDLPSHNRLPTVPGSRQCHEAIEQRVSNLQPGEAIAPAADDVYHSLLFPFADVVCIFVPDVGGPESAVRRLAAWLAKGPASTCPVRPCLVLAVSPGQEAKTQATIDRMIRDRDVVVVNQCFERIRVVSLSDGHQEEATRRRRPRAPSRALQGELASNLCMVQDARRRHGYLLSARHTCRLLCASAATATNDPWQPVDLIRMSRGGQPVTAELASHLANVLELAGTLDDAQASSAISLIASSLLLDQYPAGAHRKFAAFAVHGG